MKITQAIPLKPGAVIIGAFEDNKVHNVLSMPEGEIPLCIIPVGRRKL